MRFNALLLVLFAIPPAFSAEPGIATRNIVVAQQAEPEDIDPATGLSRTTVVRPLREFPAAPERRPPPAEAIPLAGRPHIALILPTASPTLGRVAESVRLGFAAAVEAAGKDSPPVIFMPVDGEGPALLDACRAAQRTGAMLVVAAITRDGATALARSDCPRQPVLALNEPQLGTAAMPANLFHFSLSLEHEARQMALKAVEDGWRSAILITSPSPLARRVQDAFEREWVRAAGELRRVAYSGNPEDAPIIRDRIAGMRGDMVFLALDQREARAVRPYITGALPIYATSMSVDPRAEPLVNVDLQGVRYLDMPWFVQPDHAAVMVYPAPKAALSVEQERLYALGIDAYRLALALLKGDLPPEPLDGVTGRITLAPGNVFMRALTAAEVDGGRVVPARQTP